MEIKFRAPHAIGAIFSPKLRLLDGVKFPGHRRDVVADRVGSMAWRLTKVHAIFLRII